MCELDEWMTEVCSHCCFVALGIEEDEGFEKVVVGLALRFSPTSTHNLDRGATGPYLSF